MQHVPANDSVTLSHKPLAFFFSPSSPSSPSGKQEAKTFLSLINLAFGTELLLRENSSFPDVVIYSEDVSHSALSIPAFARISPPFSPGWPRTYAFLPSTSTGGARAESTAVFKTRLTTFFFKCSKILDLISFLPSQLSNNVTLARGLLLVGTTIDAVN